MIKEEKDDLKKNEQETETPETCEKCGTPLVEEDEEKICPACDTKIDFFGEEDKDDKE